MYHCKIYFSRWWMAVMTSNMRETQRNIPSIRGQRTFGTKKGLKYSSPTCFRNKRDSSTDPNASMSYFLFPSSFWREFRIFWIRSSIRYWTLINETCICIHTHTHPVSSDRFVEILMENKRVWKKKQSFKQFDSLRNRNGLRSIRTLLNKRFLKVFFFLRSWFFNDLEAWMLYLKKSLSELKYICIYIFCGMLEVFQNFIKKFLGIW